MCISSTGSRLHQVFLNNSALNKWKKGSCRSFFSSWPTCMRMQQKSQCWGHRIFCSRSCFSTFSSFRIVSNVLSVTGSVCITVGILLISGVSLLEQRFNKASLLSRICFLNFDQSKYRTNGKLGYYFLSYLTFVIRSKKSIRFIKFFFVNKKTWFINTKLKL